jgi:hypothetical protein
MSCIVTVEAEIWLDELYLRCPGSSEGATNQALHHALREFAKQSGAWVVELWQDDGSQNPIPFSVPLNTPYYDFQSMLEAERVTQLGTPSGQSGQAAPAEDLGNDSFDLSWDIQADDNPCYVSCDPAVAFLNQPMIDAYWPWDILYFNTVAYFDEYVHSSDPTSKTMQATRMLSPSQTQNYRGLRGSNLTPSDGPRQFMTYNERPGAMQVYPALSENLTDSGIVPWVSLGFPARSVCSAIPVIFERYWYEHILDGATARLMGQQDKPYTNPRMAAYHGRRFRNGISEARDMARRQFNTTDSGWQYPKWA